MKDNQMSRGKSQALYKYLPDSWIDFSKRGNERKQYIAKVIRWNSDQLTNINKKRLLRMVEQRVQAFARQQNGDGAVPATSGFGADFSEKAYDVLTPKSDGEERGVVATISPLTFYCKKCKKVHQFRSVEDYRKNTKCRNCHIELTQFRQIYFCKCGWASDRHPAYCKDHGYSDIYWDGGYNFYCKKCGKGRNIRMQQKCEICGTMCYPKVALDPAQYFPYSFNLIDLINERMENFLTKTDYGIYIAIAYWLDMISHDEFEEVIEKGIVVDSTQYEKVFNDNYNMFKMCGLSDNDARVAAEASAKKTCGSKFADIVEDVKCKIATSETNIAKLAEMIVEYTMVKYSEEVSTLDDAVKVAKKLNTNANPDVFYDICSKYAFSNVQVCGRIPFVSCSYGYTREKSEYEQGVQLRAFKEEKSGRKNVYANSLDTEGVLFELDRVRILQWLLKNNYVDASELPDITNEAEVKMWFINNIKPDVIGTFTSIEESQSPITYHVYRLVHSISHTLVRSAAELCGLDKNSISEYIFPGVPAILIYCQNSQGFNLGALNNVFEAYFDKWILKAETIANKCIFDPICIERDGACTGCLFLNEVSCEHFNKDLDRALIIGHYDKEKSKKYYGFWEEF